MPTFTFNSPSGKTYQVTGPDGSNEQQAMAQLLNHNDEFKKDFIQSNLKDPSFKPFSGVTDQQKADIDQASPLKKLGLNFGAGAAKAVEGLRETVTGEDENPQDALQRKTRENVLKESVKGGSLAQMGGGMAITAPTMAIPGGPVVGGLMGGAAQGLAEPASSPQERLTNMGVGGGVGGAGGAVLSGLGKAATTLRNHFVPTPAAGNIVNKTVEPYDTSQAVARSLRQNAATTPVGTAPTASQASGNTAAGWNYADDVANTQRLSFLDKATGGNTADAAVAAREAREAATKPMLNDAIQTADRASPTGFQTQATQAIGGIKGATDEGRAVLSDVRREISNTRNLDADTLHELRTRLASVGESDPGVGQAKQALDHILDGAAGGKYGDYLQHFQKNSEVINAAEAAGRVKGTHLRDLPNAQQEPVGVAPDQQPKVSGKAIQDALLKEHNQPWGNKLAPDVEDNLRALAAEEGSASAYKGVSSAAPLPKNAAKEAIAAAVPSALGGVGGFLLGGPVGGIGGAAAPAAYQAGRRAVDRKIQEKLADLLRDPKALADAMEQAGNKVNFDNPVTRALRMGGTQAVLDRSK
jgi:hypothetical protein